ncbi:MAG: hypothetical protein OEV66_05465 [Spirochaetia bacterium]|nr:hypothetical protein [Spirochaetia bacterium]
MDLLHFTHIFFVGSWLGTVAVEAVIEWRAAKDQKIQVLGRWHYYIDLFVEIPTFTIVLFTGILLTLKIPFFDTIIVSKIILGLIPVFVNI